MPKGKTRKSATKNRQKLRQDAGKIRIAILAWI